MNNRYCAILAAGIAASSCCKECVVPDSPVKPGSLKVELAVTLHPQEANMWCWAASGRMIKHYLQRDEPQCNQVDARYGVTTCVCNNCPYRTSNPCEEFSGWPAFANGLKAQTTCPPTGSAPRLDYPDTCEAALSWNDVVRQFSTNQMPFAFSWHWPNGGGHMMVAIGYGTVDDTNYIEILDPLSVCEGDVTIIPYDWYVAGPGHHSHWNDFYDIGTTPGG